jgi:DNA-binding response OmpR family regulator
MSKQMSVLLIDDDRMIRQILQSALLRKNFLVYTAEDGPSGIVLAQEEDIDVILLDWMMPGMDGMEVLRRLKQDEKTRLVPIFMLTSKEAGSDIDQAISAGVDDYIVKPFCISEVGDMVIDRLKKNRDVNTGKTRFRLTNLFSNKS